MKADSLFVHDFPPYIRTYKDGRVERLLTSSYVPASEVPTVGRGVATRDVVIHQGTGVSARLFLPLGAAAGGGRLPLVIYFHGGAFCTESAFGRTYDRYATSLAASSGALVVSVEYRLAPEHPIPAAYDDAWEALRWASSLRSDPWVADHSDPRRAFLAGDSAGGNIAYHTAFRAGREGAGVLDVMGLIMVQPYFWGPQWLPSEAVWDWEGAPPSLVDELWPFVTRYQAGNDDLRINPPKEEVALLSCRRVLVAVADKDTLVHRGRAMAGRMRESGRCEVTLVESEDEGHCFHLYRPQRATSKTLMKAVAEFINQQEGSESEIMATLLPPPTATALSHSEHNWCSYTLHQLDRGLGVPTRPFHSQIPCGKQVKEVPTAAINSLASNSVKIRHGKTTYKMSYGSFFSQARIDKGRINSLSATLPRCFAV